MAGGYFAAHDESGGDLVESGGRLVKRFYGMSSSEAMKKFNIVDNIRYYDIMM